MALLFTMIFGVRTKTPELCVKRLYFGVGAGTVVCFAPPRVLTIPNIQAKYISIIEVRLVFLYLLFVLNCLVH